MASPLRAAVIAHYSADAAPTNGSLPVPPSWVDPVSIAHGSGFAPAEGSGLSRTGGGIVISGWDSELTALSTYASFSLSAKPGYQLRLETLSYEIQLGGVGILGRSAEGITSYFWGYRIDLNHDGLYDGVGEDWIIDQPRSVNDPTNSPENGIFTWEFHERINTTGTVEFGLFATSTSPNVDISLNQITVTGIPAIPEPSTAILAVLSSLALWRRRRPLPHAA